MQVIRDSEHQHKYTSNMHNGTASSMCGRGHKYGDLSLQGTLVNWCIVSELDWWIGGLTKLCASWRSSPLPEDFSKRASNFAVSMKTW